MADKKIRKIVVIDEDKCNGCGECIPSCAEGAIKIENGKAKLIADNLCDGLGNCLGTCPQDAITIEERPAEEFDAQAVAKAQADTQCDCTSPAMGGGCPGSALHKFKPNAPATAKSGPGLSRLSQWPIQLHLLPTHGDIWQDADVLIAADCTAFALGGFHDELLAGKTLAIACPKLDQVQIYVQKLTEIFTTNKIKSLTVARMSVPCCGGLVNIVTEALESAGLEIPVRVVTIEIDGNSYQSHMM